MKYSVSLLAILATVGVLWTPVNVNGQNKDIVALQRDLSDLTRRIEVLRITQGERLDALEALIKQSSEASRSLSMELHTLQQTLQGSLQKSIAEQQRGVSEPIAAVRTGVDSVGQDVLAVRGDVTSLKTQISKVESLLSDLAAAVRTINAPAPAPPPSTADSANLLFTSAEKDFQSGNNELALMEFRQYWDLYPASPNAPRALLLAGQIYDRNMQYDEARKVFDMILERFPDSTTTPEAWFWKADMLAKEGNRTAAAAEFDNFAKKFPSHINAATAKDRAAELRRAKGKGKG